MWLQHLALPRGEEAQTEVRLVVLRRESEQLAKLRCGAMGFADGQPDVAEQFFRLHVVRVERERGLQLVGAVEIAMQPHIRAGQFDVGGQVAGIVGKDGLKFRYRFLCLADPCQMPRQQVALVLKKPVLGIDAGILERGVRRRDFQIAERAQTLGGPWGDGGGRFAARRRQER